MEKKTVKIIISGTAMTTKRIFWQLASILQAGEFDNSAT